MGANHSGEYKRKRAKSRRKGEDGIERKRLLAEKSAATEGTTTATKTKTP